MGAAAAAVLGAGALVPGPPGIGVPLVAIAVSAVVWEDRRRLGAFETFALLAAIALAGTAAVRAAEWVVLPALVGGCVLASLAARGGSSWAGVLDGVTAGLRRPLAGLSYAAAPLRVVAGRSRLGDAAPVARGMALGGVLVGIFGFLFVTADRAFAEIARGIVAVDLDASVLGARAGAAGAVFAFTGSLALARTRSQPGPEALSGGGTRRRLAPAEWGTALGLLVALFAAFVAVQVSVFFAGHDAVLKTAGLTYSEYARRGFAELLAAAALTLAVVAGAARWADAGSARARVALRGLLGGLCLCTLVVVASALERLSLYEEAYGFTRARMGSHFAGLVMAAMFVLIIAAGVADRYGWLPRAMLALLVCGLLVFTIADPDRLIARLNVDRYERSGMIDVGYLRGLSADAAPELERLRGDLRSCALERLGALLDRDEWGSWNLSRNRARSIVASLPPVEQSSPCPSGYGMVD